MKLYTIRDNKVEAYLPPFVAANPGTAMRMLVDDAKNPNSMLGKHPSDFELFEIGEWNDVMGMVNPLEGRSFGRVVDFMELGE